MHHRTDCLKISALRYANVHVASAIVDIEKFASHTQVTCLPELKKSRADEGSFFT